MKSTLHHLQINIGKGNLPFYRDLFTFLGWTSLYDDENMCGFGCEAGSSLWFGAGEKDVKNDYDGPGTNHIAIGVPNQANVDETVEYLKKNGVASLFETPRHRPEFSSDDGETYYQVMFESPDRILFEVVYTGPKSA